VTYLMWRDSWRTCDAQVLKGETAQVA